MNYPNDIAPVLIGEKTSDEEINLKELEEKFKGNKIFSYDTNTYNEKTGELKPITYYYTILFLYDDGGWQIDIEISENEIEDLITSVRLVEEI